MYEINEKQRKFAINFIMYIITFCLLCFIGITRTLAYTYTTIGDKADITVVLVSTAYGSQPYNVPKNSGYNFNQVLQVDYLVNNYQFNANTHYQLESHLTAQTFTNANAYSVTGLNGEQCLVDYTASIFTGTYPRWDFECPHATTSITLTIYNNAHQYLWDNGIYTWTTALLSYSNERILVSSDTQDIIDNNNQNTQQIIESNKVCSTYDKLDIQIDNKYLGNDTGTLINDSGFGITDYIDIYSSTITFTPYTYNWSARTCYYDKNKNLLSCILNQNLTNDIPTGAHYVRISISKYYNKPMLEVCENGNQAIDKTNKGILAKIKELFSWFSNDDDADVSGLNNMVGWLPPGPVDSIINLPLSFFNALTNTLSGTCQDVTLTLPFVNQTLTLPCFDSYMTRYLTHFGTFWSLVGFIVSVFILYNYLLALYKWVDDTLTFRENNLPGYYGDNWGGGA